MQSRGDRENKHPIEGLGGVLNKTSLGVVFIIDMPSENARLHGIDHLGA